MRECDGCKECCIIPYGNVYGHEFGNGTPCKFLGECGCNVYKARPDFCKKYYCAWAQELLPIEMKPNECGVLVSVENGENGQFLRAVSTTGKELNTDILLKLKDWSIKMNAPVIYMKNNTWTEI